MAKTRSNQWNTALVRGDVVDLTPVSSADRKFPERVKVGSDQWWQWLSKADRFYFEDPLGKFTARREIRRDQSYWYACRKLGGKLYKKYIGKTEEVTLQKLRDVNETLRNMINEEAASAS